MYPQRLHALPCLRVCGFHILVRGGSSLLTWAPDNVILMFSDGLQVLVKLIVYWHIFANCAANSKYLMSDCYRR
jgi:hypothetical protein